MWDAEGCSWSMLLRKVCIRLRGIAVFYTKCSTITALHTNRNPLMRKNGSSGYSLRIYFSSSYRWAVPLSARANFTQPIRDIFGSGCFELYIDVQPALHALRRRGLRLAVVSNWHRGLDSFCHEMSLSNLLDAVISSSDIGVEKPDSRIFLEAVRRLRVEPDRIAHVGDEPDDDFTGAVAAGLRAILIDRRNAHSTHPSRIGSLNELEAQLQFLA